MGRIILPLFGSLAIHSFGLTIAIGLILFALLMVKSKRRQTLMSSATLSDTILVGVISALIGGRFLALLGNDELRNSSFTDWISLWDGGLSSLGSVLGVLAGWTLYLRYKKVPVIPFFDLAAIYAPLLHICVRIGCFLAGCCYGCPTNMPWGVIYHENDSLAPLGIVLHPTQLYSVFALVLIFLCIYYISTYPTKPGQLFGLYLLLTNTERFIVDFFRGDREYFDHSLLMQLSLHQWIALGLMVIGMSIIFWSQRKHTPTVSHS